MALPSLATVADFALWMKTTIPAEDPRAILFLESASGLVRTAAGQTWVDEDDPSELVDNVPVNARTITLTAAARAWANPAGTTDTRTGPFSGSWADNATGVLLTDDEVDTLAQLRPSGTGGLGVISTTRGDLETSTIPGDCWPFLEDGW